MNIEIHEGLRRPSVLIVCDDGSVFKGGARCIPKNYIMLIDLENRRITCHTNQGSTDDIEEFFGLNWFTHPNDIFPYEGENPQSWENMFLSIDCDFDLDYDYDKIMFNGDSFADVNSIICNIELGDLTEPKFYDMTSLEWRSVPSYLWN